MRADKNNVLHPHPAEVALVVSHQFPSAMIRTSASALSSAVSASETALGHDDLFVVGRQVKLGGRLVDRTGTVVLETAVPAAAKRRRRGWRLEFPCKDPRRQESPRLVGRHHRPTSRGLSCLRRCWPGKSRRHSRGRRFPICCASCSLDRIESAGAGGQYHHKVGGRMQVLAGLIIKRVDKLAKK